MYANYFHLHDKDYFNIRILPQLLHNLSMIEDYSKFRYPTCKFKNPNNEHRAARMMMSKEFGIVYSYSFEISFYGYRNNDKGYYCFN
jgi:hypothetical protein